MPAADLTRTRSFWGQLFFGTSLLIVYRVRYYVYCHYCTRKLTDHQIDHGSLQAWPLYPMSVPCSCDWHRLLTRVSVLFAQNRPPTLETRLILSNCLSQCNLPSSRGRRGGGVRHAGEDTCRSVSDANNCCCSREEVFRRRHRMAHYAGPSARVPRTS